MNPMEMIGQLYLQLESEKLKHRQTMTVLHGLVKGEIRPERIVLLPNGWEFSPDDNGKPMAPRLAELPDTESPAPSSQEE